MRTWLLLGALGLIGLSPACKDPEGEDCTPGAVGCPCSAGQCLAGLQCLSNFCVDPDGTGSTPSDPTMESPTDPTGDPTVGPTNDPTGEPTTSAEETGTAEPGGPVILQFLTNVNTITEGESVTFTAVVTDPDGVDDVIGGSMTSPDGAIGYGAFATSGEEGAYSLTLSWAQLHQAQAIGFETPSIPRTFRAEFFDQAGKSASKTVDITLDCDDGLRVTPAACDGACTDLDSDDDNCTHCGTTCLKEHNAGGCEDSACKPTFQNCAEEDLFMNCAEQCVAIGESCVVGGCSNQTSLGFQEPMCTDDSDSNYDHPCDEQAYHLYEEFYFSCCCTYTI